MSSLNYKYSPLFTQNDPLVSMRRAFGEKNDLHARLNPGQWYESRMIEAILSEELKDIPNITFSPHIPVIRPFIMKRVLENAVQHALEKKEAVLIPVNVGDNHWTAMKISLNEETGKLDIIYNDSFGHPMPQELKNTIRIITETHNKICDFDIFNTKFQNNTSDCGPLTIFSLVGMATGRLKMQLDTLENKDADIKASIIEERGKQLRERHKKILKDLRNDPLMKKYLSASQQDRPKVSQEMLKAENDAKQGVNQQKNNASITAELAPPLVPAKPTPNPKPQWAINCNKIIDEITALEKDPNIYALLQIIEKNQEFHDIVKELLPYKSHGDKEQKIKNIEITLNVLDQWIDNTSKNIKIDNKLKLLGKIIKYAIKAIGNCNNPEKFKEALNKINDCSKQLNTPNPQLELSKIKQALSAQKKVLPSSSSSHPIPGKKPPQITR